MKFRLFALFLGAAAIATLAFGFIYRANSAPLPEGFPAPTPHDRIEVKHYPAYRAATVRQSGQLSQATNRAFSPLFEHISDNEISMTSPVEARYPSATLERADTIGAVTQGETRVSFLYRTPTTEPREVAANVEVEDLPPVTVVSLGRRGSYDYLSYQQGLQRLQQWLERHPGYEVVGSPRRFFYDGPFIPDSLKRSEIHIPIRAVE